MKLNEIMVIKKDDTGNRLKLFQVDDDTFAKLTKVRGNLYKDDPRLTLVRDLPEHKKPKEPECVISPEMKERAEASYKAYKENERKAATTCATIMTPEPPILSFDEQIQNEWRTRPDIRAEFISLTSYEAYCRAVRDGRTKVYGCKS